MAIIVPSHPQRLSVTPGERRELEMLETLQTGLPADYRVFHSVHWSTADRNRIRYGEADFVIVNRAGAVLVLELKCGAMQETADGLFKVYNGFEKDAGRQLRRNIDALKNNFGKINGRTGPFNIDYLMVLPDHRLRHYNGAMLQRSRIVDASRSHRLVDVIQSLLPEGEDTPHSAAVTDFFNEKFAVVPDIHSHAEAGHQTYTRLTGGFIEFVEGLRMTPFRLRIDGAAGCGKSSIASRRFGRAVKAGRHTLLLCFNRPLADQLRANLPAGGMIDTWYGFCRSFLQSRGEHLDFTGGADADFWRRVQDRVMAAPIDDHWLFDTVIVDEGQDFSQEWADIVSLFWREGADVLWLGDPNQRLWQGDDVRLDGFVGLTVEANYRTPDTIADFIAATLDLPIDARSGLPGLGAHRHEVSSDGDTEATVSGVIDALLKQGFAADQIQILSLRGLKRASFLEAGKIGRHSLRWFTGDYDRAGAQIYREGDIRFDTIGRFKGQQREAVVLVDLDHMDVAREHHRRQLYTAMTRATLRLDVVAPPGILDTASSGMTGAGR